MMRVGRIWAICSIFLILLIILQLFLSNASANYSSIPDIHSEMALTAQDNSTPVYMKAEDIQFTIKKDERAYVEAEYLLENPGDEEHHQELYLPFYQQPENLEIRVNDGKIDYEVTEMTIRVQSSYWDYHSRGLEDDWYEKEHLREEFESFSDYYWSEYWKCGSNESFFAITHDYLFQPYEAITILVTYDRPIQAGLNEPASDVDERWLGYPGRPMSTHGDWAENMYYYKCLYITRTGATWNNPINVAAFTFKIHKDLLNSDRTFVDGSVHDNDWGPRSTYLTEIREVDGDYVVISITYYDWTPEQDIGVCWMVPRTERENFNKDETNIFNIMDQIIAAFMIINIFLLFFIVLFIRKRR